MVKTHTHWPCRTRKTALRHRLRSKTLPSLKPKISQALDSLLEEIHSTADTKILRTTASRFRQPPPRPSHKSSPQSWAPTKRPKSCLLCKQASRNDRPTLSLLLSYLPPEDPTYLSCSCFMSTLEDEDTEYLDCVPPFFRAEDKHSSCTSTRLVSSRFTTKQSPHFKAFYGHYPIQLKLNTGAETSIIKSFLARSIAAPITKSLPSKLCKPTVWLLWLSMVKRVSSYPVLTNNSLLTPLLWMT